MNQSPKRLAVSRVHIAGAGRVGTSIALALHAAGVGHITCNDPQMFDEEQLGWCVFSRRSDLGQPKVHVLERFLHGRPEFVLEPIVAPNESLAVTPHLARASLIVSCANRLPARLRIEQAAVGLNKPCLQAAVQDGRDALGGVVSVWLPKHGGACFGCLFPDPQARFRRGEVLLPSVTSVVADLAAHLAVQLLVGIARDSVFQHNVFTVDLQACSIERLWVQRRPGCAVCGAKRARR